LPREAIADVVNYLKQRFPDGNIICERHSYEGKSTIIQNTSGKWIDRQAATFFPLLKKVSSLGEISPFLSKQWSECQSG
jgi:hypothetical protein